MERRRAVGPISTRGVRIGDPISPRRPRSRSTPLSLVYFISFLFLWNIQKEGSVKKEKKE